MVCDGLGKSRNVNVERNDLDDRAQATIGRVLRSVYLLFQAVNPKDFQLSSKSINDRCDRNRNDLMTLMKNSFDLAVAFVVLFNQTFACLIQTGVRKVLDRIDLQVERYEQKTCGYIRIERDKLLL